ncbi:MAG: helix-turn-helix domain-containing protein [Opitutaceae bacterium]
MNVEFCRIGGEVQRMVGDGVWVGIDGQVGQILPGLPGEPLRVNSLRTHWKIARFEPAPQTPDGEGMTIDAAAKTLGVAPSTLHRWLNDGFIPGEQITPGAPWRIRVNDALRARFVEQPPEGYVPMIDATRIPGVSRQTVLQRVKRGELDAVHVRCGRRKGFRIKVPAQVPDLFNQ